MKYVLLFLLLFLFIRVRTSNYLSCPAITFPNNGTCDACSGNQICDFSALGLTQASGDYKIDSGEVIALNIPNSTVGSKETQMLVKALSYALRVPTTTIYVSEISPSTQGGTLFYFEITLAPILDPASQNFIYSDGSPVLMNSRVSGLFSDDPFWGSPDSFTRTNISDMTIAFDNDNYTGSPIPRVQVGDPAGCVLQAALVKAGFPNTTQAFYNDY